MPISETHKKQKSKNYALLILLLIFIGILVGLTFVKLSS